MTEIVDAHHHLWDLEQGRYPWLQGPPIKLLLGEYSDIRRDYLIEDLLADFAGHGIVRSVHVQADWDEHADPVAETAWLQSVADRHGFPHAIVAWADLAAADIERVLDRHAAHRNLRGVRMLRPGPSLPGVASAAAMLDHPAWRRGLAALTTRGLVYDMRATPPELEAAARLARDMPQATIVLNHLGFPRPGDAALRETWRAGIAALASCPNVAVKLSGFAIVDRAWTLDLIRPWVDEAIERFGPARCMFASNFPVDRLGASYARIVEAIHALIAGLGADDRHAILAGTARRIYRI